MVIEIQDLVKKYGKKTVVDGVSLNIKEGEVLGLLGPNGAGKSTTISAILGLVKISAGDVKIFGQTLKPGAVDIKKRIGYVPQDFAFFPELSAYDNVTYWAKLYQIKGKDVKEAVKEALDFVGLWDRRKDKAKTYSGGMKRRLNIACAIVHKPDILIMDEPTVGVDPQSRNNILDAVRILNQKGTTVIYTSHYMEEIQAICNQVAIMDNGRIIAQGTIDELIHLMSEERKVRLDISNMTEEAYKKIQSWKFLSDISKEENEIHFKMNEQDMSKLMEELVKNKIEVIALDVEKPNLETVFLQLTGKKLRD
ncbi:ABC transporter ATP-binding protein [Anaeromicropila populeti]|uniref:ABC-2 type transport system ATP-binding protein n=1 Tax=Anaeromicropila populeti TaxID=37658 RepID=A0A1I6IT90_9FIRM|nr:ABC transporter ATP-binding protein [Anaeromicropila populeti]SFR69955.1 ABC-2 type transport system ATP-binding protein [Anaeromicropila populeti]